MSALKVMVRSLSDTGYMLSTLLSSCPTVGLPPMPVACKTRTLAGEDTQPRSVEVGGTHGQINWPLLLLLT